MVHADDSQHKHLHVLFEDLLSVRATSGMEVVGGRLTDAAVKVERG
jgi:hypothetical protein